MSINPSTAIDKALSKAAGESYVTYKLARNGWMAVNANSGVANMPNLDLIGLRHDKRITIQIKAAKADKSIPLAGSYKADGVYFNTKEGPKADFVVSVMIPRDGAASPTCYVFPVDVANRLAQEYGDNWAKVPKRDGTKRSTTFPIWLKGDATSLATNYREAWGLLDTAEEANPISAAARLRR